MINKNQHLIQHHAEQLVRNDVYLNLTNFVMTLLDLERMEESAALENAFQELFRVEEHLNNNSPHPEYREVLEIYAVSEWLYTLLKAQAEPTTELLGQYLWGRCTSGQALSTDTVIEDIVLDLWPEFKGLEE